MYRTSMMTVAVLLLTVGIVAQADAQATRTWVSGVGDDVNPCSRTAPCKTFAGAISKTAAGGEISVLDSGGFGSVTITKSITIDGGGTLASILNSGVNGIVVAPNAVSDVVILRNLSINGAGLTLGPNGIRYLSGLRLVVENVSIRGMSLAGIEVAHSGTGNLIVRNSDITGGTTGVKLTSGTVNASLSNVSIRGAVTGVDALVGAVDIDHSVIAQNSAVGALAEGGSIDLQSCMVTGNGVAVQAATGSTLRISDSDIFNNATAFGCGGGTLASSGTNHKGGNVGGAPSCLPNAMITIL